MIILGIDPGIAIVGYGVLETDGRFHRAIDAGVINTPAGLKTPERLEIINKGLNEIIDKFKPDAIAMEEIFFNTNQKTAITVAEARGVIILTSFLKCRNLYEYTPLQIKQALTGYGRADKKQIQTMVAKLLKLSKIPKPDDAADALAVALTHAQSKHIEEFRI